jgi:uncharacterized membrane protein
VSLPIGAFFLTFVADVVFALTKNASFYAVAQFAMGVGIVTALLAAVLGLIDYFGITMSAAGRRLATTHMRINLAAVALYAISFVLRRNDAALGTPRWPIAFGLEVLPFLMLGVSGWIGGKMTFEHKIGVVEWIDPEAREIGMREAPK